MHLALLVLRNPLKGIKFLYTWIVTSSLVVLQRLVLPHFPVYQDLRTRLQRAYLSSTAVTFPDLVHRLPVGPLPDSEACHIKSSQHEFTGYLIPGTKTHVIEGLSNPSKRHGKCVILYAHGGGYARGEAKMYLNYMKRWERIADMKGLDLVFLSVEYPLTDLASHPAQRNSFLGAYRYLLELGIPPKSIVFMGDSAGGGICISSAIHCLTAELPQPVCSVLHSPWIDPTMPAHEGGNAMIETDYLVAANTNVPDLWQRWLGGISATSPDVNPLYRKPAEIERLCPQLILIGAAEFAMQEGKEWAKLCLMAGVKSSLVCERGQMHIYSLGSSWLSKEVRERTETTIFAWIKDNVDL